MNENEEEDFDDWIWSVSFTKELGDSEETERSLWVQARNPVEAIAKAQDIVKVRLSAGQWDEGTLVCDVKYMGYIDSLES